VCVCGEGRGRKNLSSVPQAETKTSRSRNPHESSPVCGIYCKFGDSTLETVVFAFHSYSLRSSKENV
jgi:hypothetical protein